MTADLHSLLYKYELDLAQLIREQFQGNLNGYFAQGFQKAAEKRKQLIRKYLWNPEKSLFFDYNWKNNKQSTYVSSTTFYPLWAGKILTQAEAKRFKINALASLKQACGLAEEEKKSELKYLKNYLP